MNQFFKLNKNVIRYSLIFFLLTPILGFKLISVIGNIILILFLIPILLFIVALISINSLKPKINTCNKCGSISIGQNNNCIQCGADLSENFINHENFKTPAETTIEVEAEEIK